MIKKAFNKFLDFVDSIREPFKTLIKLVIVITGTWLAYTLFVWLAYVIDNFIF